MASTLRENKNPKDDPKIATYDSHNNLEKDLPLMKQ